jgi:hypothetical protein
MVKKVVGYTTELYKAVVLERYKCTTADSLPVGLAYGSPRTRRSPGRGFLRTPTSLTGQENLFWTDAQDSSNIGVVFNSSAGHAPLARPTTSLA